MADKGITSKNINGNQAATKKAESTTMMETNALTTTGVDALMATGADALMATGANALTTS